VEIATKNTKRHENGREKEPQMKHGFSQPGIAGTKGSEQEATEETERRWNSVRETTNRTN